MFTLAVSLDDMFAQGRAPWPPSPPEEQQVEATPHKVGRQCAPRTVPPRSTQTARAKCPHAVDVALCLCKTVNQV